MLSAPPQCVGTLPFPGQSKAILCKEDSILQTWYNQEHAYPNTRVVIGCIGFRAKSEPDIKWEIGDYTADNSDDIKNKLISRVCVDGPDANGKHNYKIERLSYYSWLQDKENNVYDILREEWKGKPVLIEKESLTDLAKKGIIYHQTGTDIEQALLLDILTPIYEPFRNRVVPI